jgi:hypothetical protein
VDTEAGPSHAGENFGFEIEAMEAVRNLEDVGEGIDAEAALAVGDLLAGLDAEPEGGGVAAFFAACGDVGAGGVEITVADDEVVGGFGCGGEEAGDVGDVVLAVGIDGDGVGEAVVAGVVEGGEEGVAFAAVFGVGEEGDAGVGLQKLGGAVGAAIVDDDDFSGVVDCENGGARFFDDAVDCADVVEDGDDEGGFQGWAPGARDVGFGEKTR